jgi:hypothetical protein
MAVTRVAADSMQQIILSYQSSMTMFSTPTSNPAGQNQPEPDRYQQNQQPFTIFIGHLDKTRDGHWRPAAHLRLTRTLRTSGFLTAIAPEELRHLFFLLSFLTANGDCTATLSQLAEAMKVSIPKCKARMQRLAQWQWRGQALVHPQVLGNDLEAYALAPGAIPIEEETSVPEMFSASPPIQAAPREVIIAHSRAQYARPRAEVEQQIAEQNDWDIPVAMEKTKVNVMPDTGVSSGDENASASPPSALPPSSDGETDSEAKEDRRQLRRQLENAGLTTEIANGLLERFDHVRIQRQLMWLPYRKVRNPAGFLIAAIKDDYAAPPGFHGMRSSHEALPQDQALQQISDALSSEDHLAQVGQTKYQGVPYQLSQAEMTPLPLSDDQFFLASRDAHNNTPSHEV